MRGGKSVWILPPLFLLIDMNKAITLVALLAISTYISAQTIDLEPIYDITRQFIYTNDTLSSNALEIMSRIDEVEVNDSLVQLGQYECFLAYGNLLEQCQPPDSTKAERQFRQAIRIFEQKQGTADVYYIFIMKELGQRFHARHEADSAISYCQKALVKGEYAVMGDSTKLIRNIKGECYLYLGLNYYYKDYDTLAIMCYRKAHDIQLIDFDSNDYRTVFPLYYLAVLYENRQQRGLAIKTLKELLDIMDERDGKTGYYDKIYNYYMSLQP